MRRYLASAVVALFLVTTSSSFAQRPYAGSYYASFGIGVGPAAGAYGYGGATVFRSGLASTTLYYPISGLSETYYGAVSRRGILSLDPPNLLSAKIYRVGRKRFAFGVVGSPVAGGNFFLTNYQ